MMKYDVGLIIIALCILLFAGCHPNKDADYFSGSIQMVDDAGKEVKHVSSHLLQLNGANYGMLAAYDSLLICWNPKLQSHYFNVFNVDTGEELGMFCSVGQGPEEVANTNMVFQIVKDGNELKSLHFEIARGHLLVWNITRSVQTGKTVWDTIVPFTNRAEKYRTHNFVFLQSPDTVMAYVRADYISGSEIYTPYYEKRLLHNNELLQNFFIYKKETVSNSRVSPDSFFYTWDAIKPDGTKIVQVMRTLPQLNIIDTRTGEVTGYRVEKEPGFALVEASDPYTTVYYNWVHADDNFIYAVYWGKEQWGVDINDKVPELKTIHLFDWEGRLRYELQTDRVFFRLWADPVRHRLYTQNHDTDEVYYIDLNELDE